MFSENILAKAEEFKKRISPDRLRHELLPSEIVNELCDLLWSEGIRPQTKHIQELFDVNSSAVMLVLREWSKKKRLSDKGTRGDRVLPTNIEELRAFVSPELHTAPLTCLDPTNDGRWSVPSVKNIAYLGRIDNQSVRDLCCLYLLMHADHKQMPVYGHISNFSRFIQIIMIEQQIERVTEIDPNILLYQVLEGKAGHGLTANSRQILISFWNQTYNQIDDYLEQLSEEQKQIFKQFQIRPITDRRRKLRFRHWKTVREAQQERVKAKTAVVHEKFHKIRFMAKVRLNQTKRLFEAAREAVDYVTNHNPPLPHRFSYVEETYTPQGRMIRQQVTLALWDRRTLVKRSEKYNKYPVSSKEKRNKSRMEGFSNMTVDPSPEPSVIHSNYAVEFIGIDPVAKNDFTEPFWFLEFYHYRLFSSSFKVEFLKTQEEFNRRWGYPQHKLWMATPGFYSFRDHLKHHTNRLRREENRFFLPVEGIYAACLFAALCVRIQTITGARIGEVLQIAQNPECIVQLDSVGQKQETKWLLRLVPKGRREKANYFIDAETKDLLLETVSYLREKFKSSKIPIVEIENEKTPPDRYLFQWGGRTLGGSTMSVIIRVLLHGIVLKEDGKAVHINTHLLRHAFATEMANLKVDYDIIAEVLHQRDESVTKYYARPTPQQVATAAEVLFVDRVNVTSDVFRNPEEVRRMLADAEGKIGALTEVIGGTCVVANMCPVKFACIGCAGNAPDPAKRYQIERKNDWAKEQAKWAREENLLVEERQLENIQKDCHIILEEMDLIEKARLDEQQAITLQHEAGRGGDAVE